MDICRKSKNIFLYILTIYMFLLQVGYVTTICFLCFLVRCIVVGPFLFLIHSVSCLLGFEIEFDCILLYQMCFNAFDKNANLDVLDHPILNFIYYLVRCLCSFPYFGTYIAILLTVSFKLLVWQKTIFIQEGNKGIQVGNWVNGVLGD